MRSAFLMACLVLTGAQASAATMEEAAREFEAKRWAQAAAAYQEVAEREPANALALIRLARSRAANGQAPEALAALEAWFATGSGSYQVAMGVPEFETLREDPRFIATVAPHKPCNSPEFRQFDFWLGDWDVESAAAPGRVSRNVITAINDGCTLREEYTTPDGYTGTSLNFYDAPRQQWHQTWIDTQGGALYLQGGREGESMVLRTAGDSANLQRITWTPLADGSVRQHWESTSDGGKTWTTVFDGRYTKKSGG
jgi:hypothetical protein